MGRKLKAPRCVAESGRLVAKKPHECPDCAGEKEVRFQADARSFRKPPIAARSVEGVQLVRARAARSPDSETLIRQRHIAI